MLVCLHTFDRPNKFGGYKPGDVIQVKPNGFDWRDAASEFRIVRMPNNTFTPPQWKMLAGGQYERRDPYPSGRRRRAHLRHRRYFFRLTHLPPARLAEFAAPDTDIWTAADFIWSDIRDKEALEVRFTRPEGDRSEGIPPDRIGS